MGEEIRFRCPVAARCGGCQMEKMSYAQQLAAKQDWVRDLLRPYCRVDRILGMENPFHYRNKTHAVIASDKRGNVISGGQVCTVHGAGTSSGGNSVVENTLIPDAQLLIQQAQAQLNNMDASSANYAVLQSAISNLQSVISSSNPSTTEVAAAMGQLTTAMAGGY